MRKLLSVVHKWDASIDRGDGSHFKMENSLNSLIEHILDDMDSTSDNCRLESVTCCITNSDIIIHTIIISYDSEVSNVKA